MSPRREPADIVMVHRGAAAFAQENSLAAYEAALDYGADGCEIDIRAGLDGEPVLFHDDMLDRLTGALGRVEELNLAALLSLPPREGEAAVPILTLRETLRFARPRRMLLHLDIKQPGIARRIADELEAASAWPLVVQINPANAGSLVDDPRYRPLRYRGPGLYDRRLDVDPDAIRAQLQRPGRMIMVDDPRTAALVLGRQARPGSARWAGESRAPAGEAQALPGSLSDADLKLRAEIDRTPLDRREGLLLALLRTNNPGPPGASSAGEAERARRIAIRARAALEMGRLASLSGAARRELRGLIARRSLHREWMYMGLDGAMAARALGLLRDRESVASLISAWERVPVDLGQVQDPRYAANPLAWTDFRLRSEIIPALHAIGGAEAGSFLRRYIDLPPEQARELAPLQYEAATLALLGRPLSLDELQTLLRHGNPAVRGTAILECRDRPSARRLAALRQAQPWALRLPSAADHPARGQELRKPAAEW